MLTMQIDTDKNTAQGTINIKALRRVNQKDVNIGLIIFI